MFNANKPLIALSSSFNSYKHFSFLRRMFTLLDLSGNRGPSNISLISFKLSYNTCYVFCIVCYIYAIL